MKRDKLIQIEFDFDSKESEEPVQNNFNFEKKYEDVPQGIFDFDTGNPHGFENFQKEREEFLDKVRKEWRLPIGKIVRIKLFDIDGEFEGKLKLAESPKEINHRHSLYLKVGDTPIESSDIEQYHVLR